MSLIEATLARFEREGLDESIEETEMDLGTMFTEQTSEEQRQTILKSFALAFACDDITDETHEDARTIVRNWEEKTDAERLAVTEVYAALNEAARDGVLGFQSDAEPELA